MHNSPLDKIKVASPCTMEWRWMSGNDRVRYCRQCSLNVYNLSAMSQWEAEDLISRTEGRLCVKFYRRADGTILTKNCPVGLQAIKKKWARTRTHILGALMSFLGFFSFFSSYKLLAENLAHTEVVGVMAWEPIEYAVVQRSESFMREKAAFKVNPIYHSNGSRRIRGDAVVKVFVSAYGNVISTEFVNGNPVFKEMAEDAARRWRFEPVINDGMPVRVESRLTFHLGR
jgi:TonB family protein